MLSTAQTDYFTTFGFAVLRGFDRDRYPIWRDWLGGAAAHPCRGPVIERMRHAGVLDLAGAQEGW